MLYLKPNEAITVILSLQSINVVLVVFKTKPSLIHMKIYNLHMDVLYFLGIAECIYTFTLAKYPEYKMIKG